MAEFSPSTDRLATVFGGSGFLGRHIVRALAREGWRIRVAVRRPDLAGFLRPLGVVGQIELVQANLRYPEFDRRRARGRRRGRQRRRDPAPERSPDLRGGARGRRRRDCARAPRRGSTNSSMSRASAPTRARPTPISPARAAATTRCARRRPRAVILRPSVVFGPEDDFLNRFGALARVLPALPLFGGGATKLQPVFVGDVALAALAAIGDAGAAGRMYELGGPEVLTLREIAALTLRIVERRRALVPVPFALARLLAWSTEVASTLSLGAFPAALTTTRDQVELLRHDNVVSAAAIAEGRTLRELGISAQGIEAVAPSYLYRFRKTGQYAARRLA